VEGFEVAAPGLFAVAYRVAFRLTGSDPDASDMAQESLARAFERWAQVESYAEAWVARTATNLALDRYRQLRRRPLPSLSMRSSEVDRNRVDLIKALRALPRRQRDAVVLRYLADLDEASVAERMGCSVGAVKQHAHRGLQALRISAHLTMSEDR
jgi:RNA polymerase sigma factor (sigma-70 family)